MAQVKNDKSGNAFKFSLFPLLGGVVLIFGLYYGCNMDIIHDTKPAPLTTDLTYTESEKAEAEAKKIEEAKKAAEEEAAQNETATEEVVAE